MIEAVSIGGYESASVKRVITLAGVSRRAFYEHFANRQDCFLATFDLLASRGVSSLRGTYMTSQAESEPPLQAVLDACVGAACEHPKALQLVLIDVASAGEPGLLRMCRGAQACEQILGECLTRSGQECALPAPLLRALTGGIQGALAACLRSGPIEDPGRLSGELLEWTLASLAGNSGELSRWMSTRLRDGVRAVSLEARRAHGREPSSPDPPPDRDSESAMLEAVLRLSARHGHSELTPPQIAETAGVSTEEFFARFQSHESCLLDAHAMVGRRMLESIEGAALGDPQHWSQAVRPAIETLMTHLAARPVHARALAQDAFVLGGPAIARNFELAERLGVRLTAGAPSGATAAIVPAAIAGAVWHTVRQQVANRRVQLLPALTDHLSFAVLAPFLGAEAALRELRDGG
jgi:AcrR family transcriptional regulator